MKIERATGLIRDRLKVVLEEWVSVLKELVPLFLDFLIIFSIIFAIMAVAGFVFYGDPFKLIFGA